MDSMGSVETIERVAIRHDGIVYSLPRPARHCHVTWMMGEQLGLGPETMHDQGFVTSTGRYVSREEACIIARQAGQIKNKTCPEHVLFSEDVW